LSPSQVFTRDHHPHRIGWLDGIPRHQDDLLRFPGVEILQSGSQRTVLRIPPSPSRPTLIAKIHRETDLAARFRRLLGWGRARLEWNNLVRAEQGGASVPRPVALERHDDHDIVFIDFLLDTEPFSQHLERYQGEQRAAVLRVLGRWIASIMRAGVDAHDIHTGNILVRGVEPTSMSLWLIDLHDARIGFGVPAHRRRAMVQQVASALGGARAAVDVQHFLEGWAYGARALGVDATWALGADQHTDDIDWAEVEPKRVTETLQKAERAEIHRRCRHISRALRNPVYHRRNWQGVETVHGNPIDTDGILRVRRERGRAGLLGWLRSRPTIPRASWFGDRVRQTVWRCLPRAALFIERCSGEELIVEKQPGATTLAAYLKQSPDRSRQLLEPLLETLHRHHFEGIHLDGASAAQWYIEEGRDGFELRPDPASIRYRGRLTREHILEDLIGLGSIFDGSLTARDRLRGLLSYPGFSSLSAVAVRAVSDRLGQRFAAGVVQQDAAVCIRPALAQDVEALHILNEANAPDVGSLSAADFAALIETAAMVRVVDPDSEGEDPAGLLVVMRPEDDYGSPNFLWFRRYFDNFAYVDRVAIAASARRRGIGSALYAVTEAWARARDLSSIVCEVNLEPRNEDSLAFHLNCGFREVGQKLSRGKAVMMLQKLLRH
jgi:predicted GNAT superfamily acetyltransferase